MAKPNDVNVYQHYTLFTDEQHKKPRVRCKFCNDSFTKDKARNATHLDVCVAKKRHDEERGIIDGPYATYSVHRQAASGSGSMNDAEGEIADPSTFQQGGIFNPEVYSFNGQQRTNNVESSTPSAQRTSSNKRPLHADYAVHPKIARVGVAGLAKAVAVMRGQQRMLSDLVEGKATAEQIEYTRHLYVKQIDDLEDELQKLEG